MVGFISIVAKVLIVGFLAAVFAMASRTNSTSNYEILENHPFWHVT